MRNTDYYSLWLSLFVITSSPHVPAKQQIAKAALVNDAEGIAKVHVYTWQSTYLELIPESYLQGLNVEQGSVNWTKNIETPLPGTRTVVAEINEEIVGFIGVGADQENVLSKQGEVYAIYVRRGIQGRGIGAALMRAGLQVLSAQGFTSAVLWVLEGNLATRGWYESQGWKSVGRSKTDQRENFTLEEIEYRIEFPPEGAVSADVVDVKSA